MPLTSNHNLTVFDFAADNISEKVQVMFVTSQSDMSTQKTQHTSWYVVFPFYLNLLSKFTPEGDGGVRFLRFWVVQKDRNNNINI